MAMAKMAMAKMDRGLNVVLTVSMAMVFSAAFIQLFFSETVIYTADNWRCTQYVDGDCVQWTKKP